MLLAQRLLELGAEDVNSAVPFALLAVGEQGVPQPVSKNQGGLLLHAKRCATPSVHGQGHLGLCGQSNQLLLHLNDLLVRLLALPDSLDYHVFGDLNGSGLHHGDGVLGSGHNQVQFAVHKLGEGGVDDDLSVDIAEPCGAHRPVERYVRQAQGGGRSNYPQDVRVVLLVRREDGDDDLDLVVEALGEQWPQWAVRQTGGQGCVFGWPALPSEEAARNLAGRV